MNTLVTIEGRTNGITEFIEASDIDHLKKLSIKEMIRLNLCYISFKADSIEYRYNKDLNEWFKYKRNKRI
ncbi:hypothetical protein [uncultured Arcobacter sp.]|uniref:hypothetical protein n=1 Tax=uncultured Arcobacter sp. TaxID=165434 RepID=UPI002629F10C|nr:hypothetical protein [uncultured Arcobacter sp.]